MLLSNAKMQSLLSIILLIGILISTTLVLIGGIFYLLQHGHENLQVELLQSGIYQMSVKQILQHAKFFTPFGIIELGLLILVVTQLLRVALITFFYITAQDFWFALFSLFILFVLIYSFIWRS